ncbi:MAG: transglycosylase SLT domain-containing protein [Xanthomonadales bacterium]|nr:transglycosylase SLT domain-containing protein [Xanthomonadales bacterium]
MLYRFVLALLLLSASWGAAAFETFNRIREQGAVRIGVLAEHRNEPAVQRARSFAETLGLAAEVQVFDRADRLVDALRAARIDLVGTPVDRNRPLAEGLRYTIPVDLASVRLAGRIGPVSVRYGSDAWHRAIAMRAAGRDLLLEVLPAETPYKALFQNPARRVLSVGRSGPGSLLAADEPRSWVVRGDDRVLLFKLNRYLLSTALLDDARDRQVVPSARLLRAYIGGALTDYDRLAQEYGRFYGFDWRLILAVMNTESGFDPDAVSGSGAFGLMQLKPVAAREVGIPDVSLPRDNVLAGVRYLAWAFDQFEEDLPPLERTWFALAAYNGGYSRIREARRLARVEGRNPRRWFGHVEHAVLDLGRRRSGFDANQVVRYVQKVRSRFAEYARVTEGPAYRTDGPSSLTAAP